MRWTITLLLSMLLITATGCVFTADDAVPDTVVVDTENPPDNNTTIIEHDTAPNPDVDVNIDSTK